MKMVYLVFFEGIIAGSELYTKFIGAWIEKATAESWIASQPNPENYRVEDTELIDGE